MGKRILVTSTDLMMIQFLVPHIKNLAANGFEVEIACSDVGGRLSEVKEALKDDVRAIHQVRLHRNPADPDNLNGYRDMKSVIAHNHYDVIWTNEPVMGVMTRLAARKARKSGTRVLYMTHGFHFQTGGSLKYWLAFYPVEYIMSYFTDCITTINLEDYKRAQKMLAKDVRYIHGIGMNTDRLHKGNSSINIRKELGIDENSFLVLSVGELNQNKNQQVIIRVLSMLKDPDIHYVLCGKGDQLDQLKKLAEEEGIMDHVHFLGYRNDVVDICAQSDIFVLPSFREGLPIAPLEAMYTGIALVTSDCRGPSDFMVNGRTGFMCFPKDVRGYAKAIRTLKNHPQQRLKCGRWNQVAVKPYLLENVKGEVLSLFRD